jgi:hypothetical protein
MRVTYTVSVLIIVLAMGVAYKFLPAWAPKPAVVPPYADADAVPVEDSPIEGLAVGVENVADSL